MLKLLFSLFLRSNNFLEMENLHKAVCFFFSFWRPHSSAIDAWDAAVQAEVERQNAEAEAGANTECGSMLQCDGEGSSKGKRDCKDAGEHNCEDEGEDEGECNCEYKNEEEGECNCEDEGEGEGEYNSEGGCEGKCDYRGVGEREFEYECECECECKCECKFECK